MSLGADLWEKTHGSQVAKEKELSKPIPSADTQAGMSNQNAPAGALKTYANPEELLRKQVDQAGG